MKIQNTPFYHLQFKTGIWYRVEKTRRHSRLSRTTHWVRTGPPPSFRCVDSGNSERGRDSSHRRPFPGSKYPLVTTVGRSPLCSDLSDRPRPDPGLLTGNVDSPGEGKSFPVYFGPFHLFLEGPERGTCREMHLRVLVGRSPGVTGTLV